MLWKPTPSERRIIRDCASRSAGMRSVKIEVGERYLIEAVNLTSINIRLLSNDPDWNDTDLYQSLPWSEFVRGVPLTDDGRALVDFYVYSPGEYGELKTNVQACYEHGALQWVEGTCNGRIYEKP